MSATDAQELKEMLKSVKLMMVDHGKRLENVTQLIIGNPLDNNPKKGVMGRIDVIEEKAESVQMKVDEILQEKKMNRKFVAGIIAAGAFFVAIVQVAINYLLNHK